MYHKDIWNFSLACYPLLTYRKQRKFAKTCRVNGCDLLSKLYLWHIGNNGGEKFLNVSPVVICFQNCIFDISETTNMGKVTPLKVLWFAFKIVSLTYRKQSAITPLYIKMSCDLLSKLYLWHIGNNKRPILLIDDALWFAFKIVSLTYRKQ